MEKHRAYKRWVLRLTTLPLLLSALLLLTLPARAETIRLAADVWCPFNCEADGDKPGFMIDIAREIFARHGIEVEYVVMPWKRAITEARTGRLDGIVGALHDDAPGFIFPVMENGFAQHGFFTLESDWSYEGPDSVRGHVFGTARGYSYGRAIDELIGRGLLSVDMVSGNTPLITNLQKLKAGRIEALVAERSALAVVAQELSMQDRIRFAGTPDKGSGVFIAFSPKGPRSQEYADMLDMGMIDLRFSGRLKEIMARYGLKDWK